MARPLDRFDVELILARFQRNSITLKEAKGYIRLITGLVVEGDTKEEFYQNLKGHLPCSP